MNTLFDIPPVKTDGIIRDARFTKRGLRTLLTRRWTPDEDAPYVLFCMLNPSTANATTDDPTIRRCMGFARAWGYQHLKVINLFDYVTPNPNALKAWVDENHTGRSSRMHPPLDVQVKSGYSQEAALTVCGWGTWGAWFPERVRQVMSVLKSPHALRITKDGHPSHPLYLPVHLKPIPFDLP